MFSVLKEKLGIVGDAAYISKTWTLARQLKTPCKKKVILI